MWSLSVPRRLFSLSSRKLGLGLYSTQVPPTSTANSTLPLPRLDYRALAENITSKTKNSLLRKAPLPPGAISKVAETYTDYKYVLSTLNSKRNTRAIVGERIRVSASSGDNEGKQAALEEAKIIKEAISQLENELSQLEAQLLTLALAIPNDTHPDTPIGPPSAAVTLATGGPDPIPADPKRDHVEICKHFGLLDLESAATVSGSSWYFLMNEAALLENALINYALALAIRNGFTPVTTPDVVRSDIASRCGFQPRDNADSPASQVYHLETNCSSAPELILSGTSEIPLAGMFANRIYNSADLPRKLVGLGHAFRAEAGARGADTRGLYRVHQFTKVELFSVTSGEASEQMMDEMMELQKRILLGLNLPFRVLDMPTEELGASAYRKFDMEVWMPGRASWGEVSSLSNCTDFQARRLHIRYRPHRLHETSGMMSTTLPFAHTLNGTAAAVPRLIIALLENGVQFSDNGVPIGLCLPTALRPFWIDTREKNIIQWVS
ncbi:hypothetical protein AMATHDRAFT_134999 [Amanita thiersii Skay4041]|uniref:serine--tRNA ligase n=1 Tax=Amanita thiersii Skay4041 TaxID=703135 RepID=A0A2A9NYZ1_9AGAR|nr:hypothetical protein AMATHDRAFT_134999 [Amanita thiersii Skay4041]